MDEPLWQVVSRTVQLRRTGRWYIGLCPFHQDTNPSFVVGDFSYHCFGCGVKGTRKTWNVSFPSIIGAARKQPTVTSKVNKTLVYPQAWIAAPEAMRYFSSRGIEERQISKFKLGYNGWRYTIPCYDAEELVGVKLRIDPKNPQDRGPKYVSLPGSKRSLFNKDVLQDHSEVIYCEGELDCILLDQLGLPAVTSTAGCRSFDNRWLRYFEGKQVLLWLDNDPSGKTAQESLYRYLVWSGSKYQITPKIISQRLGAKDVTDWWAQRRATKT